MPEEMKKAQEEKVPVVASAMVEAGQCPYPLGKVPVASTPSSTPAAAGAAKVSASSLRESSCRNAQATNQPYLFCCFALLELSLLLVGYA